MSSIKEIAKLAEVSLTTASIVINGKGDQYRISAQTQQRILEAARTLNYRPNISARRLRSEGETVSPVLALFWTLDTRASLIGPFLKGVQLGMRSLDSEYELLIQPYVSSKINEVNSLLTGTRFNGAIIANASEEDERFLNDAQINVPIVLYQRNSDKYCSVNVDNYRTGQEVMRLFHSRGHNRIGLISPDISSRAIRNRKEGFLDTVKLYGISVDPDHIAEDEFSEEGGYQAAKRVLDSKERPTAIFVLSDQMAVGALLALREHGIEVPRDIEIVGHDNYENARFAVPPLTTVNLPVAEMAAASVQMLAKLLRHEIQPAVSQMFQPYLVVRDTCGGFLSGEKSVLQAERIDLNI
ncbi:LacI family DNA-binding transcriptional regulator [Paenibacillus alkalitolerans]|uniref:LacI family DNA-binding transcriptional regulator n=1 Tax=Paenibacillus alkalitolerans TaxID=2799335 RepID=UPI0018F65AFB|nr:LacI family DNA-binding transcriptional regulator [Paenibacillus alkalitolerans]